MKALSYQLGRMQLFLEMNHIKWLLDLKKDVIS